MRYFIPILISLFVLSSCDDNKTPSQENNMASFVKLFNELQEGDFTIIQQDSTYELEESEDDWQDVSLETITEDYIHISLSSSGTGGSDDENFEFYLLPNADSPTILEIHSTASTARFSSIMMEARGRYPIDEDKADTEAAEILEDELASYEVDILLNQYMATNYSSAGFSISVWQKQNNEWQNAKKALPTDWVQKVCAHNLFFKKDDYGLTIDIPTQTMLDQQPEIVEFYYGKDNSPESNLYLLNYEEGLLNIGNTANNCIQLQWNGKQFSYLNIPKNKVTTTPFVREACAPINAQTLTFTGKIDNQYDIQMELQIIKEYSSLKGNGAYWYSAQNKKMAISTSDLGQPILGSAVTLIRTKEDEMREQFMGIWTSDCKIEGQWTHFGTLKSVPFYLQLIQ